MLCMDLRGVGQPEQIEGACQLLGDFDLRCRSSLLLQAMSLSGHHLPCLHGQLKFLEPQLPLLGLSLSCYCRDLCAAC